jgi:glyoxylase-like metal-dependent hydrolase (beta-lactamase superfamily II)
VVTARVSPPGSLAVLYDAGGRLAGAPHVFTGDSLFPGGVGKTNFDAAYIKDGYSATVTDPFTLLLTDVTERLFDPLPDPTWVYPGHGHDTTIGAERPHLPEWRERGW